ncbi:MAG TPA: hypothetical protein VG674_14825 [Amycolatopsis sp.]|nr:hypothetical protein [Amycolatopsis sp.]
MAVRVEHRVRPAAPADAVDLLERGRQKGDHSGGRERFGDHAQVLLEGVQLHEPVGGAVVRPERKHHHIRLDTGDVGGAAGAVVAFPAARGAVEDHDVAGFGFELVDARFREPAEHAVAEQDDLLHLRTSFSRRRFQRRQRAFAAAA